MIPHVIIFYVSYITHCFQVLFEYKCRYKRLGIIINVSSRALHAMLLRQSNRVETYCNVSSGKFTPVNNLCHGAAKTAEVLHILLAATAVKAAEVQHILLAAT